MFLDSVFQCCLYRPFGFPDARFKRLLWPCSWKICDTQVSRRYELIMHGKLYVGIFQFFVLCRYAFPIKCTEVVLADDNETILEIRAEYDPSKKTKPKVYQLCQVSWFKLVSSRVC